MLVDERFFRLIDTDEKAYWLGFLMADGCNTNRVVMLGLATKDADHVRRFAAAVKSTAPIKSRTNNFGNTYTAINVCSVQMCADLSLHGVVKAKSKIAAFPKLPLKWQAAFVRGVFDGDGCIHVKQIAGGVFPMVEIVGARVLMRGIKVWCGRVGIRRASIRKHHQSTGVVVLWITNIADVVVFRDHLYSGATVALERKRALLYSVEAIAPRTCEACGKEFQPRYRTKGRYCSTECYHGVYYAENRDVKWKRNGEWR